MQWPSRTATGSVKCSWRWSTNSTARSSVVPDSARKSNIDRCCTSSHRPTPPACGRTGTPNSAASSRIARFSSTPPTRAASIWTTPTGTTSRSSARRGRATPRRPPPPRPSASRPWSSGRPSARPATRWTAPRTERPDRACRGRPGEQERTPPARPPGTAHHPHRPRGRPAECDSPRPSPAGGTGGGTVGGVADVVTSPPADVPQAEPVRARPPPGRIRRAGRGGGWGGSRRRRRHRRAG